MSFSLIVYDFDGIMTDNRHLVLEDGREGVFVSRSDGWAVARIRELGIPQVIISTEENAVVAARARKLKIEPNHAGELLFDLVVAARARKLKIEAIHGVGDKAAVLTDYAARHGIDLAHAAFLGNDVNDLPAMRLVGLRVAPSDSHPDVLAIADMVLKARGGEHAVREFYETRILPVAGS
ncbi:MAG: HAD hydrolase family protein [Gammaproteobacteria bacterium]